MGKNHRAERLGEEIRKVIGEMLVRGSLKDPRFTGMIGISGVDVSSDGSYATVYVTVISYGGETLSEEAKKDILAAFESSEGYIRHEIGESVKVRYVPQLSFRFDNSFDYGMKMDRLIDSLNIRKDEDPQL